MIVYELLTLSTPWTGELAEKIEELVRSGARPPLPQIKESPVRALLSDMMVKTWSANPALRPEFEEIVLLLKPLGDLYLSI